MGLAAALLIGLTVGRFTVGRPSAGSDSPRYLLLLYGQPADGSTEEYRRWAGTVRARGHLVSGDELADSTWVVRSGEVGNEVGSPGPSDPTLVGFFIVSAGNADEARALARECPHARRGGTIVVRAITPT